MSKQPDTIVRISVSLPASIWEQVEDYRAREGAVTTADAVRRLMQVALRAEARKKEAKG